MLTTLSGLHPPHCTVELYVLPLIVINIQNGGPVPCAHTIIIATVGMFVEYFGY